MTNEYNLEINPPSLYEEKSTAIDFQIDSPYQNSHKELKETVLNETAIIPNKVKRRVIRGVIKHGTSPNE